MSHTRTRYASTCTNPVDCFTVSEFSLQLWRRLTFQFEGRESRSTKHKALYRRTSALTVQIQCALEIRFEVTDGQTDSRSERACLATSIIEAKRNRNGSTQCLSGTGAIPNPTTTEIEEGRKIASASFRRLRGLIWVRSIVPFSAGSVATRRSLPDARKVRRAIASAKRR